MLLGTEIGATCDKYPNSLNRQHKHRFFHVETNDVTSKSEPDSLAVYFMSTCPNMHDSPEFEVS